jgi:hypothetical protein
MLRVVQRQQELWRAGLKNRHRRVEPAIGNQVARCILPARIAECSEGDQGIGIEREREQSDIVAAAQCAGERKGPRVQRQRCRCQQNRLGTSSVHRYPHFAQFTAIGGAPNNGFQGPAQWQCQPGLDVVSPTGPENTRCMFSSNPPHEPEINS